MMMKGNEAIAEAAVRAGCRLFFGYPITPQNEIPEYMSKRLFEVDGQFVQAESEVAASNMIYGAAAVGARCMTSSSSPGITLKQEGLSYCAGSELPVVVVNIMRAGPGLGGIQPSQSDYFQATRPGHGDWHSLVLAPSTVQEAAQLTMLAFDLADEYRNPVTVLGDGLIGQMMEPVSFDEYEPREFDKSWTASGCAGRDINIINSLYLEPDLLEAHNKSIQAKYQRMREKEVRVEHYEMDGAKYAVTAYGIVARIAKTAVDRLRADGVPIGLLRPITLFPFPVAAYAEAADRVRWFLDVEMSTGQLVDDVRLATSDRRPIHFYGRYGGIVPAPDEIEAKLRELLEAEA